MGERAIPAARRTRMRRAVAGWVGVAHGATPRASRRLDLVGGSYAASRTSGARVTVTVLGATRGDVAAASGAGGAGGGRGEGVGVRAGRLPRQPEAATVAPTGLTARSRTRRPGRSRQAAGYRATSGGGPTSGPRPARSTRGRPAPRSSGRDR
ncbi:hypothetical protein GCM10027186_07830 [Micromonospora schwarzwaldensis]